jgi:dihydroorotase
MAQSLLIRAARPVGFPDHADDRPIDLRIDDGRVTAAGQGIDAPAGAEIIDARGAWISPGWADLHAHVYHGGTDISIRPSQGGLAHGVTTIVDAGSSGEGNFVGFREFIAEPAAERVVAFLNIGSIGLVACNRVSELIDQRSIDITRTLAVIEANRDIIRGIKCRACSTVTGAWGITPVKIAKKVAKIARLPLMVHVGEPPPLLEEVLEILTPGDVLTHCFHGKPGGNILEDEELFGIAQQVAAAGVRLDVGHGGASFSFKVARAGIERGLFPFSISTDLHLRSIDGPVWDMATTMSKLLAVGMPFAEVVAAASTRPRSVIGLPAEGGLAPGAEADFTLFELEDASVTLPDSSGDSATLDRLFAPRHAILGTRSVKAARLFDPAVHG